ncbi:MAG: glycosyltransferase family 4 protein [Betaproteobacteria bacterium]|nr:glycosyltransferase family 4 protein [Betaproteobacteria bacterium]
MRQILFISKGENSASTRYRALQFFPLLRRAGYAAAHATAAGSPMAYLHALRLAAAADIVVVLRKTFPRPLLWLLRRLSRRLVFDFDDAIFCNTDGSSSNTRMRRFAAMAAACDHLCAGNRFLADNALRFNPEVSLIPTSGDADRYSDNWEKPQDFVDLVWIGSRSTRKYLIEALPALRLATAHVPNLRLKSIADFDLPDAGLPTLAIPWSAETEARELGSAHIGIAPMRDDDWSRGKCALKVLQYMAAGLPVVSSDVGANAGVVTSGQTGYLVGNDQSWVERISMLANDAVLRDRLGAEGRARVRADYSIEPVFSRMIEVFEGLS